MPFILLFTARSEFYVDRSLAKQCSKAMLEIQNLYFRKLKFLQDELNGLRKDG